MTKIFIVSNDDVSRIEMQTFQKTSNQANINQISVDKQGKLPGAPSAINQLVFNLSRPGSRCQSRSTSRNDNTGTPFNDMEIVDTGGLETPSTGQFCRLDND